jgi:uncharacterized protein (TIGR03435 family)
MIDALDAVTTGGASIALSILLKVTVLLGLALGAVWGGRRLRASVRHFIVASTFAAIAVLPFAAMLAPPVELPAWRSTIVVDAAHAAWTETLPVPPARAAVAGQPTPSVRQQPLALTTALAASWLIGAILFLVPVGITLWGMRRLRRTSHPWPAGDRLARVVASEAGVTQPVALFLHDAVTTPMTCGLFRPVIVLPADATQWTEEGMRCALVHELEHIRRADWPVHVAARILCAVYWFHPLAWMAWRRLCLEAERACDDAVVRAEDGTAYAQQLVTLARRRVKAYAQPALSMANASDLSARVAALLDDTQRRGRLRAPTACALGAAAAVLMMTIAPLRAGTPGVVQVPAATAKRPAFAVVSIRRNTSGVDEAYSRLQPGGRIVVVNQTVRTLLLFSYGLRPQQLAGGPDWLDKDRFDIIAQAESEIPPVPPGTIGPGHLMMQQVLVDRFNLEVRTEKRELPIYALTLARSGGQLGPRISPAQRDCASLMQEVLKGAQGGGAPPAVPRLADGRPACGLTQRPAEGRIFAGGTSLANLAGILSGRVGRIVEDRTGLTGFFDFDLEFAPDPTPSAAGGGPANVAPAAGDRPSLFTALEEQLGLRLQPQRAPVEVLVIDRVEPPSEN